MSSDLLDFEEARMGRFDVADSNHVFERRWAVGLLEEALKRGESHFRQTGRVAHWELFEIRVLRPAMTAEGPPPLSSTAQAAGFASPALAAAAVQVVKRRISALLREVVAETVDHEADVDDELAEVRQYLAR